MERISNNFENNYDEEYIFDHERDTTIFISQVDNCVYTHINPGSLECEQSIEEETKDEDTQHIQSNNSTIDISAITKGKSPFEIVVLGIKCLSPAMDIDNLSKNQFNENNTIIEECSSIQTQLNDDPFNLKCRKRYEKLTDSQIRFLKFNINESILTTREISNEYHVSRSEIYKIKRMSINHIMRGSKRKWIKVFGKDRDKLIEELKDFVVNASHAFNSSEITNHVNTKLQTNYKASWIRSVMKRLLNLTYKRTKPRPNSINFDKVKACRQLFALKFSQLLSNSSLVINIDETSINRHIKINYSWSLKGKKYEARNSPFIGSINWVMAIWSNRNWFSLFMNHTSNSENFKVFWKRLMNG